MSALVEARKRFYRSKQHSDYEIYEAAINDAKTLLEKFVEVEDKLLLAYNLPKDFFSKSEVSHGQKRPREYS